MSCKEIVVLVSLFCLGCTIDLPSSFVTCKPSDENFNGCLKGAIEKILPALEKGIPELNFPVSQPINLPSLTIGEGKGTVHVVQKFKDLKLYSFLRLKLETVEAKVTDKGFDLTMDVLIPEVVADSTYDFNGRVLVLPLVGNGPSKIVFKNVKAHIVIHGEEIQKKGQAYYNITTFKMALDPELIVFNFMNLFNGDKALGDEMNKVLNENWLAIWQDVKEAYETAIGLIFENLVSGIFKKVPRSQLFPQ